MLLIQKHAFNYRKTHIFIQIEYHENNIILDYYLLGHYLKHGKGWFIIEKLEKYIERNEKFMRNEHEDFS